MKEKSKFITFLLSFIPGLSHLYLGFGDRALIFFIVFFGAIGGTLGLIILTRFDKFILLLVFTLPIIWLIALIDAFSLRDKSILSELRNSKGEIEKENLDEIKKSNRKAIAMALSIIPGAGHMYLGHQKKGLIIMGAFFFTIFFMGWLSLSLFLFVLPLIWFYSFFDALHSVNGNNYEEISFELSMIKLEWVGWGLVTIGILIVVERILYPLIPYQMRNYIQTSIVSIIFILGGIKLLVKNKREEIHEEDEDICKKDE